MKFLAIWSHSKYFRVSEEKIFCTENKLLPANSFSKKNPTFYFCLFFHVDYNQLSQTKRNKYVNYRVEGQNQHRIQFVSW